MLNSTPLTPRVREETLPLLPLEGTEAEQDFSPATSRQAAESNGQGREPVSQGLHAQMLRFGAHEGLVEAVDPDVRLLELCRQGDAAAFETLFRKYQTYVYNISLGMLGNGEDASDVTQEAFLRLHRRLSGFRGDAQFSTWLYRVTVNLCITELRRRGRNRFQFLDDLAHDEEGGLPEEPSVHPDEALMQAEDQKIVHRVLMTLPPDYRAIMVLRHFQQLAYEEIAEVLGLTMSQVKTRLFRARKMFKDRFLAFTENVRALP
jgi:RNA polymerase sigma-70 factor (ECF subfamily)